MVLIRLLVALLLIGGTFAPAVAHKDHQKKMAEAAAAKAAAEKQAQAGQVVMHPMSPAVHEAIKEDVAELEAEAAKPFHLRLIDWLGRTHPFAVHFPLALFPVALVALIMARRRESAFELVPALIIVAGAAAAGAALLGWFNAGFQLSDKDPLLAWHRWLGTALGLAGAGIAVWTWRSASVLERRPILWVLGLITVALLAQGWIGGALIHGIDHLNW